MDIHEERLAFCRKWAGVKHTIQALGDVEKQLADLTDGEGAPIVIDATGSVQSMQKAFGYVAHGGSLVYVGLVKDDITFNDPQFHSRELTLLGSRNATPEDFEWVRQAMAAGVIDAEGYITHRAGFAEMIGEFEHWLKPESGVIKAMVNIDD